MGVCCTPHEIKESITPNDEFIVVCSDGLSDVISPEESIRMLEEYMSSLPPDEYKYNWDPQEAANMLASRARKLWSNNAHIDDITVCVIKLKDAEKSLFLE